MSRSPIGAREVAARVLERVERDKAFAAAALEAELARHVQLESRDRALTTELVYGSLRVGPWLLARLAEHAPRGLGKLDARVRAHLVLAAYQLAFTRVPPFAAVNEAVDAIRSARGDRLAGFANAVLRKLSSAVRASTPGDDDLAALRARAVVASTPEWLRNALARAVGSEGAEAFLACGAEPPPLSLRVEHAFDRERWLETLARAVPEATVALGRVSPLALSVRGAGKPQLLPGYAEGAWSIQEEGSQLAALAVGARQGDVVLDACAGRGNKTAVLARAVGDVGAVDACDAIPEKLERLRAELARVALAPRATYAVDWRVGAGQVTGRYDRILVDAPCTGVGTLRRRPEIALRREPVDLAAMAEAQTAIAVHAAERLAPGGTLVYVVCSVLREEAEDVVDAVLRARPELVPAPFDAPEARAVAGAGSATLRLLPHVHGTDGYFVAQLRSRGATL